MYPTSRFFVQRFIFLIFLLLGLTNLVVSDLDLFMTDEFYSYSGDEVGTTDLLNNDLDGSSSLLLSQFTDDTTTENTNNNPFTDGFFLAADDNFIVDDDAQSCRHQPSKRLRVRLQFDGQACSNSEAPKEEESVFTPADERLLTIEEVRRYWCTDPRYIGATVFPICSVNPSPAPNGFYDMLEGYLMTPLNYIICADHSAFCCAEWFANRILNPASLLLTPLGEAYACFKAVRSGGLLF